MSFWAGVGGFIAIVLVGAGAAFLLVGPDRVWTTMGPADLGQVAFETLERRKSPNDALACPADICVAKSDLMPPIYAVPKNALRTALGRVVASEPDMEVVSAGGDAERYIQRTRMMRFPDTIVVQYFDRPGGQSTLALYSRSQIGESDLGVNKARIERWLEKLAKEALVAN